MTSPTLPLLADSLRTWLSAKGVWMVLAAALLPLGLTGAWVATHQADVAVGGVEVPDAIVQGENVTISAVFSNPGGARVGAFNATLAVGSVFGGGRFSQIADETVTIEGLEPGATREVELAWTAEPGTWYVLAYADSADALAEVDEFNNQEPVPIAVGYRTPEASEAPAAPENLTGTGEGPVADLNVTLAPLGDLSPGANVTVRATVRNEGPATAENATVALRLGRAFQNSLIPVREQTETVTLAPNETRELEFVWTAQEGTFWREAYASLGNGTDPDASDNHVAEPVVVDPELSADLTPPKPPEKLTIKEFYVDVLSLLHLRILIPFIGLFYAAGVISDERERGSLVYVLTRPVPRWLLPVAKFAASFLVAAAALVVGLVGTYALLFGTTPQGGDVGFLTTPLLISLLALFVYGAFFVMLGVLVNRPYLIGAAFVLGWEVVAANFVPWVRNFTLSHHIANAIGGWRLDAGLMWLPEGEDAVRALWVILGAAVAFLAVAAATMKKKEFEL